MNDNGRPDEGRPAACVQVAIAERVFPDEPTARAMHVMPPAVDECVFLRATIRKIAWQLQTRSRNSAASVSLRITQLDAYARSPNDSLALGLPTLASPETPLTADPDTSTRTNRSRRRDRCVAVLDGVFQVAGERHRVVAGIDRDNIVRPPFGTLISGAPYW